MVLHTLRLRQLFVPLVVLLLPNQLSKSPKRKHMHFQQFKCIERTPIVSGLPCQQAPVAKCFFMVYHFEEFCRGVHMPQQRSPCQVCWPAPSVVSEGQLLFPCLPTANRPNTLEMRFARDAPREVFAEGEPIASASPLSFKIRNIRK